MQSKVIFIGALLLIAGIQQSDAYTIGIIRKAAQKAARYGAVTVAERIPGSTAAAVLGNIDRTLSYLGVQHYVSLQEFQSAAVRVGLSRELGSRLYNIMGYLL